MKNCLAIQQVSHKGLLLTGNSKTKLVDIEIPVIVQKEGTGSFVTDLATKTQVEVETRLVNSSQLYDYTQTLTSKHYYPRPELVPLLDRYKNVMKGVEQTNPLKILTLDIEVASTATEIFNPLKNPIISIALKHNDKDTYCLHYYNEKNKDKEILMMLLNDIRTYDPDIIMVYNANYDIPYIIMRLLINNLPLTLARSYPGNKDGEVEMFDNMNIGTTWHWFQSRKKNPGALRNLFPGRIIYDIYQDAQKDQSLSGKVKNRRLKTIANYFGFGGYALEEAKYKDMMSMVGTQELIDYNKSDVEITYAIGKKVYLPVAEKKAEIMDIPIGNVLNCYPSYIPAVLGLRELTKRNIIPFEINKERYTNYSDLMYRESNTPTATNDDNSDIIDLDKDGDDLITKTFEAAICYQSDKNVGFVDKPWKVDFSGYYPSTIITLNLGPDTTKLVEFRDYTTDEVRVTNYGDRIRLLVPDKSYNKEIVVDIRQDVPSFYKETLLNFRTARKDAKKKMAVLEKDGKDKSDEYMALDAYQTALKVLMNIFFGESGNAYTLYGDLGVAISIVGVARDVTTHVCTNVLKYDNIAEIDTDGIFVVNDVDIDMVNNEIKKYVEDKYKVPCFLSMEKDAYDAAFFIKMKTYVVEKHGFIEFKGSALKGSNKPILFDKLKNKVIDKILKEKNKDYYSIVQFSYDLEQFKWPDDYIITIKVKPKESYVKGTYVYKVLEACEKYVDISTMDVLEYVHTKSGIKPLVSINEKDTYELKKYTVFIDSLIASFGLDKYKSMQLDLFQ